jgi:hypothetical protein
MNKLPSLYTPESPEDFVGPAAKVATMLKRIVQDAIEADKAPIKVLFNGEPGIGKSALAKYLAHLLGSDPKWSTKKYNGTMVKIEKVEEIVGLHCIPPKEIMKTMIDPADEAPPEDVNAEAEMGAEEFLGRPLAGNPAERMAAIKDRISYLEAMIAAAADDAIRQSYQKDLREAEEQLKEWQAQHKGRN